MILRKCKKVIGAVTISVMIANSLNFVVATSLTDKQNKAADIKNQINNNKQQITSTQQEADKYLKEIGVLDKEIGKYSSELDELQKKVDEVNEKISYYEDSLQNSAQKYSSAEDMYTTRLRAIYENGMPSIIDILFQSEGISDFFSKMNVYQGILEYDKSLVGNVKNEKEYISNIKKDIEVQKLQLDQLKYDMEKSTNALNNAKSQKQNKVDSLNASKEKLEAVNKVLNDEAEKLNKEIENEIARIIAERKKKEEEEAKKNHNNGSTGSSNVVNSNGKFDWPLKGYGKNKITANFPRYPDGTRHDGVDIGVPIGTPVYAAASGEVIRSKYYLTGSYDGGYSDGYGNYVMIYHGDYTTLYGHLKYQKVVSVGQQVKKGDLIGYTASTGNSTGPHLHFEVRKGTVAVNPMQFFN